MPLVWVLFFFHIIELLFVVAYIIGTAEYVIASLYIQIYDA